MRREIVIFVGFILLFAIGSGVIAVKERRKRGAIGLIILSLSLVFWSLTYWDVIGRLLSKMGGMLTPYMQLWLVVAASAQFAFTLITVSNISWNPKTLLFLSFVPLLAAVRLCVEPWLPVMDRTAALLISMETWNIIVSIYACTMSGASLFLFWITLYETPKPYQSGLRITTALCSIPFIAQLLDILQFHMLPFMFSLPAYALAASAIGYELISQRYSEAASYLRKNIFDSQVDGLVAVDQHNTIIEVNAAFERLLGKARKDLIGKSTAEALGYLPIPDKSVDETYEFERKRRIEPKQEWQYWLVRVSPLQDRNGRSRVRLITWRDYSKKRRAEEARQKAREEMFILINSISSIARDTTNLEEFLAEAVYQIVSPFRIQHALLFLENEKYRDDSDNRYYLAAHFGMSPNSLENAQRIPATSPIFSQTIIDQQPLLIENASDDERVPDALKSNNPGCILALPLIIHLENESKALGCMCLGTQENIVYSEDEIIRLVTICEHIARLIDNERRRTLSIALSERKGLMRDLHDSVSQKLYGLVALTEAAQAALETGNKINPSQVLMRIGENARQAVREMRLFLYQMQPPDLQKDGLISAIHHRLSAVEGRADIKSRLLADEGIALTKEQEVELYYIIQEALNNILRHAHAKTVTVKLKQGKRNVILEIQDDGRGFDPKKLDHTGLGLTNMKERVLKFNGKLKITTKSGQGVRIAIAIPRESMMNQMPKRSK